MSKCKKCGKALIPHEAGIIALLGVCSEKCHVPKPSPEDPKDLRIRELRAALYVYGRHKSLCQKNTHINRACDCGFDEVAK